LAGESAVQNVARLAGSAGLVIVAGSATGGDLEGCAELALLCSGGRHALTAAGCAARGVACCAVAAVERRVTAITEDAGVPFLNVDACAFARCDASDPVFVREEEVSRLTNSAGLVVAAGDAAFLGVRACDRAAAAVDGRAFALGAGQAAGFVAGLTVAAIEGGVVTGAGEALQLHKHVPPFGTLLGRDALGLVPSQIEPGEASGATPRARADVTVADTTGDAHAGIAVEIESWEA